MTNTQRGGYRRFDLVMAGSVAVLMIFQSHISLVT